MTTNDDIESPTSTEALAVIMTANSIALGGLPPESLGFDFIASVPGAGRLGETSDGWQFAAMIRGLHEVLSDAHRALVDDDVIYLHPLMVDMLGDLLDDADATEEHKQ